MKKIITVFLTCVLCTMMTVPAFAYNYDFSSGEHTLPGLGKSTSNDDPVSPDPMSENVRRNKDAAYLPPPYFYGSGNIPTEPSSLYHDNLPGGVSGGNGGTLAGSYAVAGGTSGNTFNLPSVTDFVVSTSTVAVNTEPLYYENGSIGTLYVARTGKTITVYEGEQLDNLKKGAGHFAMTSSFDGNVGLCGHNRGSNAYFGFVKDLKDGDLLTYTTCYGSRTYEVFSKEYIGEYDYSKLCWSAENLLTLITCQENVSSQRVCVQARSI